MQLSLLFLCFSGATVNAIPVYTTPESVFSSGSFGQKELEQRAKKVESRHWLALKFKGQKVWISAQKVSSTFHQKKSFVLKHSWPLRKEPNLRSSPIREVGAKTRIHVLQHQAPWFKVQLSMPSSQNPPTADNTYWMEIPWERMTTQNAVSSEDPTPFYSAPRTSDLESSRHVIDELGLLPPKHRFKVLAVERVLWAQTSVPGQTVAWWPVEKVFRPTEDTRWLSTDKLFSRSLFDIARSPLLPKLVFVSSNGIYRTLDGKTWQQLDEFEEDNHPLAIAENAAVFIGPYMSLDHGETFKKYIRWDSLLKTLSQNTKNKNSPQQLIKILKIIPRDKKGQRLEVQIIIGQRPFWIETYDQGKNWFSSSTSGTR